MVFSDQAFIFAFLPLALVLYLLVWQTRFSQLALFLSSLIFFYWESGWYTLIFLVSVLLNYAGGILINRQRSTSRLALFVGANLIILFFFKYAAFVLGMFGFLGSADIEKIATSIILPIGISFYTFQGISYLIDVWRRDIEPESSFVHFGAYKSFFPVLIAGPIIRYRDVHEDLARPKVDPNNFTAGAARFIVGLGKKVIIADTAAAIADAAFALQGDVSFAAAWLGTLAYAVQLYFDFSGYSDMALGLALMFGIRVPENFNHPYASSSLTEFWRRWHISLSTWFRDYLYIPLGGNRSGPWQTYANLLFVFAATGLWHGAAWTFVIWGLYHGILIVLERATLGRAVLEPSQFRRVLYFFPAIMVSWVIFRSPDLSACGRLLSAMANPFGAQAFALPTEMLAEMAPQAMGLFLLGFAALLLQGTYLPLGPTIEAAATVRTKLLRLACIGGGAVMCGLFVIPQNFSPFLYFRF